MVTTMSSGSDEYLLDGSYGGPVRIRGPLRRLLLWLAPTYAVLFGLWGAVPGVLLALQVERLDPQEKILNLALVSTAGALAAMIAQPVAGLISDRTRSRLGRRTPWMLIGSTVGGGLLILLGLQTTLVGVLLGWVAVSISFNLAQAPLAAIMPDRIPRLARGSFSAVSGLGTLVGILGGQTFGAAMSDHIPLAYTILAFACVGMFAGFSFANRDRPNVDAPLEPFSLRTFLSTFWVNPVRHPDFFWGFTGRLLLNLAYYIIAGGYLLFLLADYIDLGTEKAAATLPLLTLASAPGAVLAAAFAGPLSDRLRRRKIFVIVAALLFGAAMVIPLLSPTVPAMIACYAIGALGYGVFQSVDTVLMSEVLPSSASFGKDLGIVNMAITLPQTLAPALAGGIVLLLGYVWLFPTAITLCVLGALAVLPIRSVR